MKQTALKALAEVKVSGVDYADCRVVKRTSEELICQNGRVAGVESRESYGYGIRLLYKGAWGFASSNDMSSEGIKRTAEKALKIAKASYSVFKAKVILAPVKAVKDKYITPVKIDPFGVSLEDKLAVLLSANREMQKVKTVIMAQAFARSFKEEKVFASTEGALIEQEIKEMGGGIEAMATDGKDLQVRSYPNSFRGLFQTRGFELIKEIDLPGNALRVAEEADALLKAEQCPSGEFDIILDGPQLALQVHESCGHPVELDRVLGYEASYAGTSFMTPDCLETLKYGSDIVNIYGDATVEGGLGTFGYDDEGVPAQKFPIIDKGLHVGYLMSRETASELAEIKGKPYYSNGAMRADGWGNIPLIRMVNVNLEPGIWNMEDLIKDTKNGLYLSINKSWSIDDRRINFQFGTEAAREIKNGKLGKLYKNPTYTGITPKFWNSCDAICSKDYWKLWGTPNCGKGEPSQLAHVGHGTAPARFRKVKVGVGKWS